MGARGALAHYAELLHHRKVVGHTPSFDGLTVGEPQNAERWHIGSLPIFA
jgi:hypothetical protein